MCDRSGDVLVSCRLLFSAPAISSAEFNIDSIIARILWFASRSLVFQALPQLNSCQHRERANPPKTRLFRNNPIPSRRRIHSSPIVTSFPWAELGSRAEKRGLQTVAEVGRPSQDGYTPNGVRDQNLLIRFVSPQLAWIPVAPPLPVPRKKADGRYGPSTVCIQGSSLTLAA